MSETIVGILNATGIVIVDGGINDIRIVAVGEYLCITIFLSKE